MFNGAAPSFKDFYLKQSSGRYTAKNTVTDWVKVPCNAATYGDNAVEDFGGSWAFVARHRPTPGTTPRWRPARRRRRDQGLPRAVRQVWDRYDFDGDGDFNEPDGYIDHFQAIHAGERRGGRRR